MPDRVVLTLGHSSDPDDAFMWWPITGTVAASPGDAAVQQATGRDGAGGHADPAPATRRLSPPPLDTGRFEFRAVPLDIEALNRRAIERGDLDVTALSARAWAEVSGRYVLTACGASFGDGYGPKVVCRADAPLRCEGCLRERRPVMAVPGSRTTAFLVLSLLVGAPFDFVEMPFEQIIAAVSKGGDPGTGLRVDAGLVIHEAQLTFEEARLRQVVDLGAWWKERTGLPLPLGLNAVRRDLDARHGAWTVAQVADVLRRSIAHAAAHRDESLAYASSFAHVNADRAGDPPPDAARVARFVDLYVNRWTIDMGDPGREAIRELLSRGSAAGLCPRPGPIETV